MSKTPEYTKKAIKNYVEKFDRVTSNLPKGTKDKILQSGYSINSFIIEAVQEKLQQLENK